MRATRFIAQSISYEVKFILIIFSNNNFKKKLPSRFSSHNNVRRNNASCVESYVYFLLTVEAWTFRERALC